MFLVVLTLIGASVAMESQVGIAAGAMLILAQRCTTYPEERDVAVGAYLRVAPSHKFGGTRMDGTCLVSVRRVQFA